MGSEVTDERDHPDPGATVRGDEVLFGRMVGERLRSIRRQKRLSLQDVERSSDQEFKASVLGAYERGERALSVPRLARLAALYQVPVDQLLPEEFSDGATRGDGSGSDGGAKVRLDLARLRTMKGPEAEMLSRYVEKIQLQRQDFNGRVLTIRGDDMSFIACVLGVPDQQVRVRLVEMGIHMATEQAPDAQLSTE